MKHVFYVCKNVSESLGLEKLLNFYNIIALEKTDAIDDYSYSGGNVFVAESLNSPEFKSFVENFSYGEVPYVLSSVQSATVKLSQLYDWEIKGAKGEESGRELSRNNSVIFTVYKKNDVKIFGNIHKYLNFEHNNYSIDLLDWSSDYINEVKSLVENDLSDIEDGFTTVECSIDDNKLSIINKFTDFFPKGGYLYTRAQIVNNESPLFLLYIYDDPTKEDHLNFSDNYIPSMPVSQTKPYEFSEIYIRSKYESTIKNNLPSGLWKYGGDSTGKIEKMCIAIYPIDEDGDKTLCLLKRGYSIYDLESKEGFVICTRDKGISLTSGDVLATVQIPSKVINDRNELFGWVYETVDAIIHNQMR